MNSSPAPLASKLHNKACYLVMKWQQIWRMWNLCVRTSVISRRHSNHNTVESSTLQALPRGYGKLPNRKAVGEAEKKRKPEQPLQTPSNASKSRLPNYSWSTCVISFHEQSPSPLADSEVFITALEDIYGWPVIPTGCNEWHLLIKSHCLSLMIWWISPGNHWQGMATVQSILK